MATTEIHMITSTPEKALDYVMSDKVSVYVPGMEINEQAAHEIFEENGLKYIRYSTLTSFQDCESRNPYFTYRGIQEKWQGTRYQNDGLKSKNGKEPLMWHLHQSFDGLEVSPAVANEIGRKLAEEVFKGFSVTISTHSNTGNIHNHFIVSAWDKDGKKWNNCNANYQKIRRVSDRLCDEYGLNVLDHTRDVKLIRYEDEQGNTHYYEPTDRKNALMQKRKAGEISTDDVGSYRNTQPYAEEQKKKKTNREEIKEDIDTILPSCRSYEELLIRLRDLGYVIRDKKKNGDWLSHVAFQGPLQDKATRDDKISDDGFYTRESLTRYIEEQVKKIKLREEELPIEATPVILRPPVVEKKKKSIPYFAHYEYGVTELAEIDDHYKTIRSEDGSFRTEERTEAEKKVLSDVRMKDKQVRGLIDTTYLDKIIAEQKEQRRQRKPYLSNTREQRLVAEIQSSFRCLQYAEQHHIYGYEQIINLYAASKAKYDATIENFTKAEVDIKQLKELLLIPRRLTELEEKIERNRNNINYILEEYNEDKQAVAKYRGLLVKHKINTPQAQQALEQKVAEFEAKQNSNRGYMAKVVTQMSELENCIRTFNRIDTERGNRNEVAMWQFEQIARPQRKQEKEEQKKKGREER